jgi:DNA replication protein DnaC
VRQTDKTRAVRQYYDALYRAWGPQHWWPAETQFEVIVGAYLTQNTGWTNVERALANLRQTGQLSVEGIRRVTRCDCYDAERVERLLRQAHIPERYEHCAFENFDIRRDNQSLRWAKLNAENFVKEYPTDFGLLFVGTTGVGKTHLAVAVLRELILRKGVECLFYDFHDLLKAIRDSYNPVSQNSELSILQPVLEAEVLLLDELASTNPSDWVKETLQHIINSRYNHKKVTLITTTLPFGESQGFREVRAPSGEVVPNVELTLNQLGVTLRSRLYEMCKVVEMNSDDYRKAIKQAAYKFHAE